MRNIFKKISSKCLFIINFITRHSDEIWFFIKKGRYAKAYNLLWTHIWVRDLGGGQFDRIFRRFPRLAPYPKEIEIEITTRCHLKCVMCEHTYWPDNNYRNQDMDFEQFKAIIDQFPSLRYINVTGEGTGFLNKHFFKMLDYLNKKNVNTMFVESFDLFQEEHIRRVIELDVERIEVSLDAASKDTYEKLRVGAKWQRVLDNLKTLQKLKEEYKTPLPYIFFRFIAMKDNVNEIPEYLKLISTLDVNLGKLTDVQIVGLLSFPEIDNLNIDHIPENIINESESLAKQLNINFIWSHTTNSCDSIDNCSKWLQPYIMIDGSAILDCALLMANNRPYLKKTALGNLYERNFRDIWNSERYKKVRERVNTANGAVPKLCEGCRGSDTKSREKLYGILNDL